MANNPTVVIGSLNDEELKKSIDKLVNHVDQQLNYMVSSTKVAVMSMNKSLKSLGDTKIDFGGSADGGASKRAKTQNAETDAVEKNVAARDKQIKKNQEVATSFDQMANAQQKAVSGGRMGIMETYNMQIELFKNRLREVRQDIDIYNAAIGSGKKTQIEWGQQGLKQANAEAEKLMRIITTLENQRGNLTNVLAPQGHTIQNYVNSLQKANPELAQLNDSFKRGQSLMQNGIITTQQLANAQGQLNTNTNQSKQTLDDMNAYIRQNIQREQERRDAIRQTGLAARETADQLIRSAHEQASAKGSSPITGTKELTVAVEQMRRAYFDMSATEKASPIGLALEADIKRANEAISVIRQYNRSLLGVGQNDSGRITNASTLDSLRASLKVLTDQYNKLTVAELNAGKGDALIQHFQDTTRAAQILQRTLNRPVSLKAALAGDERTLDDIAYKIQRLQLYKRGLNLQTQSSEIRQVDIELNRLNNDLNKYMGTAQKASEGNLVLARSWNYMKNRLAFYFTVGASTQFVKNLIEVRSQYEMNERALGILINSAERGTQIFNELSQMALVSPYTLIELSSAAKQLTAYDIAAKDVVNTTRRLADMAAAVGIPIERLTYALGQVKAYGYLNARDARMFANAGIPLVKNLSEYYTELEGRLVSTADIYDRIKKKQIGYEEVMSTISKMTDEGGKFFDFQAKMAETLKVQLANLTLAWNNMLNDMGEESQGVIVGGIGALKQMFLHWKDIEHVLYELVVALGAYKAYQIITTRLMGATAASLDAQVLAMKRNKAALLEKQALTRKLTVDELRQVAAQNQVTAADYRNALSGKQLTKQKALLLVALNKNNAQLKAAVVNMGLLTTQEVANITTGRALAIVFKSIGISVRNAALAVKAFMASMWPLLVIGAIYELYHAWDSYGEHVKEVNKQAAEHAKEAFENIKQYLESDVTSALQDRLAKGGKVESDAAGQKAWDEMREKIELSSSASNAFIAKLMQINDINARLSDGFGYLEDIQRVAGVMQTLEEDAVNISSTTLGGLFGEGLKDDLADFINAYQKYVSLNENLRQGGVGEDYFNDQKKALEEFRGEVEKTTTSLYNIASKEGFNTNEQREFFEREISEIAQAEQMGAKETRIFRMQAEQEYYAYARAQLVSQLEYQQGAQKALTQKRINDLDNEFGKNKALQESFFTWLTEKQDHAVKNMLRGKTQEEIKQGEWLKGSNAKLVEEMARKFSEEYNVSFDDLRKLVLQANTWSINIPVFFQTIGQPLSDVQRDYEARTGKKFSSNPLIKDAKTQVEILDILKKKQKEVANEKATAEKAGGKYWEDNKQRYEEENNALIADIHAYNALTDAEEKANKKSGKGGSKKDPLLDALKQEISLVEKLQSDYDKLSKSGASQADALDTIRGAYGKTIRLLNTQLQSYGLPQIDISQLITGKDPNKALAHFKQTLDTLVSKGMLTLERSKELEAVVEKFTLSAKTYNLDMITKGLNNELGKLKDEYELAVELDANPEMGNMFTEMFGINTTDFPRTIGDYMNRVQQEFDDARKGLQLTAPLNIFKASSEQWYDWGKAVGYSKEQVDDFKKSFDGSVGVAKKWAQDVVKQTQDLQYKLADNNGKIAIEYEKLANLRQRLEKETNEQQKKLLDLQIQYQQNAIAKLKEEILQLLPTYQRLFGEVAEHSAWMTRKLAKDYKNMLVEGKNRGLNPDNTYSVRDPITGQIARITKERMGKEIKNADKELQKTQSTVKKITEAFKKGEDGVVDWVHGIELIGEELGKLSQFVGVVKEIASAFGNPNEYNETAEIIGDIGSTIGGLSTAAQGIAQIYSGDIIGGATNVLSGLWDSVSSWFDNSDKEILQQIKDSEKEVKKLENSYKDLEYAIEQAYGMAEYGARRAAIANRQLQLVELQRQLRLEQSRDSKHRDEDRILELKGQIIDLRNEIAQSIDDITNDLLGISSVGNAAEELVSSMIDAFKQGEDYMLRYDESFEKMIDNMIMKAIVSRVIGDRIEQMWNQVKAVSESRGNADRKRIEELTKQLSEAQDRQMDIQSIVDGGTIFSAMFGASAEELIELAKSDVERIKAELAKAEKDYAKAIEPTKEDVDNMREMAAGWRDDVKNEFEYWMGAFGIGFGEGADNKQLSGLQQGIAGVSEETASAVEAYLNGISQQAYLRNDLLTQIRDTIMSFDMDIQLGVFSQMLLQLQNNYIVMQSMQSMMENWTVPSGSGIRVELMS